MGVKQVWLLDPSTRAAILCMDGTMIEQATGELRFPILRFLYC